MPKLKLSISPGIAANLDISSEQGVAANIYANSGSARSIRGTTLPVGASAREFDLPEGDYTIECILPSGEILIEDVEMKSKDMQVTLYGEEPTNEWMTRQKYSANTANQYIHRPSSKTDVVRSPGIEKRMLESASNLESIVSDDPDMVTAQLDMIRGLMSDQLFDVSKIPEFTGRHLWRYFESVAKGNSELDPLKLLQESGRAMKSGHEQMLQIKCEVPANDRVSLFRIQPEATEQIRRVILWSPAGIELLLLPHTWRALNGAHEVPIEVTVDRNVSSRRFRATIVPDDPEILSILGYMSSGALTTAAKLIRAAERMLYGKISNPLVATIGGYILLQTDNDRSRDRWPDWVGNLPDAAPWLPDARVLNGWLHLMNRDIEAAKQSFGEAFAIGVPVFTPILKMLLDGLRMIAPHDERVIPLCGIVQQACYCVNPTQAFSVFQLGNETGQKKGK